jgi:hypothetical protein
VRHEAEDAEAVVEVDEDRTAPGDLFSSVERKQRTAPGS